jgi:hypothetical protein
VFLISGIDSAIVFVFSSCCSAFVGCLHVVGIGVCVGSVCAGVDGCTICEFVCVCMLHVG